MAQLKDLLVNGSARVIGSLFANLSGNVLNFGVCSTAAATAAKTVTTNGTFELITGSKILVLFSETDSSNAPTLNVNGTGAKSIKINASDGIGKGFLAAQQYYWFIYDGTNWRTAGAGITQIIPTQYGGTGNSSFTANRVIYSNTATKLASGTVTTDGAYLSNISYLSVNREHQTDYRLWVNGFGRFDGNLTLYSASGDSPGLIFHRNDGLTDWSIYVTGGQLSFASATDASTWTKRAYFLDGSGTFVPGSDAVYNLGKTDLRWKNIFLSGSTKRTDRIYPYVTSQERSQWYKITFPYYNATTSSSPKWFMSSFDLHIGGSYGGAPTGVIHVAFYQNRSLNNGVWHVQQASAHAEGPYMEKVVLYYRIEEPGILYVNNNSNEYNGIWLDNLYVDDTAPSLDWSTTKIETCSAITVTNYNIVPTSRITNSNNKNIYFYENTTKVGQFVDGALSLFPQNDNYREGLRIHSHGSWSSILLCGNNKTDNSGTSANSWFIGNNNGNFYITRSGSSSSSTGTGYLANTDSGYWHLYNKVGVNGKNTSYTFYVNGTSYFNGNATFNGNINGNLAKKLTIQANGIQKGQFNNSADVTVNLGNVAQDFTGANSGNANNINADTFAGMTRQQWLNTVYPIGSIYMSVNSTSPAMLFGGKWEQLKDRFLLAAGSTYAAGSTGGEASHTLTVNEMPKHNHEMPPWMWAVSAGFNNGTNNISGGTSTGNAIPYNFGKSKQSQYSESVGGGSAHNNMPPYLTVYMWKRTA